MKHDETPCVFNNKQQEKTSQWKVIETNAFPMKMKEFMFLRLSMFSQAPPNFPSNFPLDFYQNLPTKILHDKTLKVVCLSRKDNAISDPLVSVPPTHHP